jgi:hypothetical protein
MIVFHNDSCTLPSYNDVVAKLVHFVKKRDPRVAAHKAEVRYGVGVVRVGK